MTSARYLVGDVFARMAEIPDGSIDLVMTSPPFLALRSYLPADHPDKALEIGSEPDPASFIDTLLALSAEFRRVLAPHGSICVELGDTYSGSGGAGGDYSEGGLRQGQNGFTGSAARNRHEQPRQWSGGNAWPLPKSLAMIPELYRVALAYGVNPLTGAPSPAGRWRCRNVVRWHRPNPPVGALGDKFRPATSDMVIACVSGKRYFDLDAVRTPAAEGKRTEWTYHEADDGDSAQPGNTTRKRGGTLADNPAGAPPLDTWVIPTAPYSGSHYAVYPPALLERPIKSMVPAKVCTTCGEPSRRIVEQSPEYAAARASIKAGASRTEQDDRSGRGAGFGSGGHDGASLISNGKVSAAPTTVGWSECGCGDGCSADLYVVKLTEVEQGQRGGKWHDLDEWPEDEAPPTKTRIKRKRKRVLEQLGECADPSHWRRGVVADPFAGSGTTLMVATGHGHDAIGIDLDARNADLALERVGPLFLTIEHPEKVA